MTKLAAVFLLLMFCLVPIKAQDIEDVSEAGSYEITITGKDDQGNETQKEVLILIKFRNTIVDQVRREAIDGVNIRYTMDESLTTMTSDELIQRGRVRAWNMDTGIPSAITSITIKDDDVTFKTDKKTAITVKAFQTSNLGMNLESNYIEPIVGRNFSITNTLAILSSIILIPVFLMILFQYRTHKELQNINRTLYKQ